MLATSFGFITEQGTMHRLLAGDVNALRRHLLPESEVVERIDVQKGEAVLSAQEAETLLAELQALEADSIPDGWYYRSAIHPEFKGAYGDLVAELIHELSRI